MFCKKAVVNRRRHKGCFSGYQRGSGILDTLKDSYKFTRALATEPQLFKGERHTVLKVGNNFKRASYMGPGTKVVQRQRLGMRPLTKADKVAERHDLDYSLAENEDAVRAADVRMVNSLKKIEREGTDSKINTKQGLVGIKSKMWLEDAGVPKKAFTTFGKKQTAPSDIQMLEKRREELQQQGFGSKKIKSKKKVILEEPEEEIKPCETLYRSLTGRGRKKKKKKTQIMIYPKPGGVPKNVLEAISGMTF